MSLTISALPNEMLLQVFSHSAPHERTALPFVCSLWTRLTFEPSLWNKFVKIFDIEAWKEYAKMEELGLCLDDIDPIPFDTAIRVAAAFFVRMAKKGVSIENDGRVAILTLPKNLSMESLYAFGSGPKKGNVITFLPTDKSTWTLPKVVPPLKSYRILITNILAGSIGNDLPTHQSLLKKIGSQPPRVLEAATLAITSFVSSPESNPELVFSSTLLRCIEPDQPNPVLFCSGFADETPPVSSLGIAAVKIIEQPVSQKIRSFFSGGIQRLWKALVS